MTQIFRLRLRYCFAILCLCLTLAAQSPQTAPQRVLQGFDREGSNRERALEKQFDSFLRKEEVRDWMKRLSARPHHLGSSYDKENAEFIASLYRSWGYETEIERFDVLFPTPNTRILEMTSPETFIAKLEEPTLKEDATSGQNQSSCQRTTLTLSAVISRASSCTSTTVCRRIMKRSTVMASMSKVRSPSRATVVLARHQAQSRGGAWRDRLYHLFRSPGRRLLRRRRISHRRMEK